MSKSNSSRKVPQMPAPTTSKWGRNGEERAALLRVRTGRKALRAVRGSFFKLWESKEKLTSRNTLLAVRKTKGLRNSREEPSTVPLEVVSRGEGKGANSAPEKPPPPTLKTGPRFLSKDILRPDSAARTGAAEGKGAPHPGKVRPSLWLPEPLAAEGKGTPHPGRGRPGLWLPEPLRPGKTQNAGASESALLWSTRKLELPSTQGPLHTEQPRD